MAVHIQDQLTELEQGSHLCLLYETSEEQARAVAPFIAGGLERNECCIYIVDEQTAGELEQTLDRAGIDTSSEQQRGALVIETKRETYLRGGTFDAAAMLEFLAAAESASLARGRTGLRITGEMTWALGPETDPGRLIEYEALLNRWFPGSRSTAICQYNRQRFSPEIVHDVLRTHPVAILGDSVCSNLYFEPPEMVLGERTIADKVDWMVAQLRRVCAAEIVLENSNRVLDEANRTKSEFLAAMSHELRTPLNAIIGYEELLRDGIEGPLNDRQLTQLGRIRANASHLRDLIDEILDLARIEGGREHVVHRLVDVREVIAEVAELAEPMAAEKGLGFRTAVSERRGRALEIETDRGKLKQILLNLTTNAIKFTERGEVAVSLCGGPDRVIVEVKDTGIGIAAGHRELIFEPFWQVEQGPTRVSGGSGLGLHVARRYARMLGGDVAVESTRGRGSVFRLVLPAADNVGTAG